MCDQEACSWTQAHQWYEDDLQSHWVLKKMLLEQLNSTPMGPDQGREHGQWLQELEEKLRVQEECLTKQHQVLETWRLAAMNEGQDEEKPPLVLQTYTVPLAQVRRELHKWVEPFRDEYTSLSQTTQALKLDPRYPYREEALAMLVPTVKSPHGRHRARVVICGNHLTRSQAEEKAMSPLEAPASASPFALYAGGADATVLRAAEEECPGRVDDGKPGCENGFSPCTSKRCYAKAANHTPAKGAD